MRKKNYVKPVMEAFEMEPTAIMAASGISNDGTSVDTNGPFGEGDAADAASKGHTSIWDFGNED